MKLVRSVGQMRRLSAAWRRKGLRVAFVPTMGALHEGHLSLMRQAKREGDVSVASIFVNPIQFGPKEDFKRYPRTLAQDKRLLEECKMDVLYCPDAAEMYPDGFATQVSVPALSRGLCGAFRPGHFDGVATVVAKLFAITGATVAFFGQKDYQQCKVIERMNKDLDLGVRVRVMPTARERDGLAMSSRNRYLLPDERAKAPALYAALCAARDAARQGRIDIAGLCRVAKNELLKAGINRIQYLAIVDGENLQPLKKVRRPAVIASAVFIGKTRLIDNVVLA